MHNRVLLINATAARSSGALTILKDFLSYVYKSEETKYHLHLLTTTEGIFHNSANVTVHELPIQNWSTRLLWDRSGFQKWCEQESIIPDIVVSFQNTCPHLTGAYRDVKLLVYYHQQLPLVKYQWKWHRSDERKLFMYAHFYRFFVNRWNRNAQYAVQLPSVKDLFCRKFANIPPERVHVVRPNLPCIDTAAVPYKTISNSSKVFLFPATPLRYKNHAVILDALKILKNEAPEAVEKLQVIFTVSSESFVAQTVFSMGLGSAVSCIGSISYEDLLSYYKSCDALLFPSKIETFGLPLVEGAMFGLPVIAASLPYAREVLADYSGAVFADADDPAEWAEDIRQLVVGTKQIHTPLQGNAINTWSDFMGIAEEMTGTEVHCCIERHAKLCREMP